jgi:nucleoside-diphosphate-sugar epimerase
MRSPLVILNGSLAQRLSVAIQTRADVIAICRRKPDIEGRYEHVAVDLLDRAQTFEALRRPRGVTHVFFSAYIERPTWAEMVAPNQTMLVNLIDAIEAASPDLAHVNLMHGTKWYGNHLGPFKTPAREDDPRHMPPNFYYDQQDLVAARQRGKTWTWSTARPHAICGFATGNPMNLVMVLAVYATISKALGMPLRHPGTQENYHALYQCTDTALLSRASVSAGHGSAPSLLIWAECRLDVEAMHHERQRLATRLCGSRRRSMSSPTESKAAANLSWPAGSP